MNNEDLLSFLKDQDSKEEKSIWERLQVLAKRKTFIIITALSLVAIVMIMNFLATPSYSASVLLKKDNSAENSRYDEFKQIVSIQTSDQLETEMELVKTRAVLDKVVDELNLSLNVGEFEEPGEEKIEINSVLIDYNSLHVQGSSAGKRMPQFVEVEILPVNYSKYYYLIKAAENRIELYDAGNDKLLKAVDDKTTAEFQLDNARLVIYWPDGKPGSVLNFGIENFYSVVEWLKGSVNISHREKTDLFEISVGWSNPSGAVQIANTIGDKFRETRIDQQKQNIRYSFDFIDSQLVEVSENLKRAESELSTYKSGKKLITVNQSSGNLVNFLSTLQAEKINTELELLDYKNKIAGMKSQYQSQGYFDQTNLNDQSSVQNPFSNLMKTVTDLEIQRIEMLQKRTETHPDVLSINEQINEAKNRMAEYNRNTLENYEIVKRGLEEKRSELVSRINEYDAQIGTLPAQETRMEELLREKNVHEKVFTLLLDKREEMRMAELSKLQDIVVVEPAHKASTSQRRIHPALALIFGLVLGIGGAFVLESMNKKITNLDDVENEFNLPVLAIIPKYKKDVLKSIQTAADYKSRFVTLMDNQDGFRESYRVLRTKLSSAADEKKKMIMFTSCEENTGKTTVVANLAISLAMANKKVLVIDGDLRKSRLSELFEMSKTSPGLISFLTQDLSIPNIYNLNKFIENGKNLRTLNILPAGGINQDSSDLLGSEKMERLIEMIKDSSYDYILFDTPPVTRVVDALVLSRFIHDIVMIVRPDHTVRDSVGWGIQELERESAKITGLVVNACEIENSYFKHRYGYGYGYEYKETSHENGTIRTKVRKKATGEVKKIKNKSYQKS
jgi:capsular exopolysaccharide synthesis family protein